MEAAYPLIALGFVGLVIALVAAILLRLPLKLLDHGTRLTAVEIELSAQSANVKKALRRIGIEQKKATSATPPMCSPQAELFEDGAEVDPLDQAARLARVNGGFARNKRRGR